MSTSNYKKKANKQKQTSESKHRNKWCNLIDDWPKKKTFGNPTSAAYARGTAPAIDG